MSVITFDRLRKAMPDAREQDLATYLAPLDTAMTRFAIDTPTRIAAFLAQVGHESGDFRHTVENLKYSWPRLRTVFPKYFTSDADAQAYDGQEQKIANRVYANRMGNGNEASGDGWRYRGRGLIQITGREMYEKYLKGIETPGTLADPDQLVLPPHAALSACWFWGFRNLNALADQGDDASFALITRRINGGLIGQDDRVANWEQTRSAFV